MTGQYYVIVKQGVYGHGVYWVGTELEAAKKAADLLAENDIDDYHKWVVSTQDETGSYTLECYTAQQGA